MSGRAAAVVSLVLFCANAENARCLPQCIQNYASVDDLGFGIAHLYAMEPVAAWWPAGRRYVCSFNISNEVYFAT